jgi:hypothetical protein
MTEWRSYHIYYSDVDQLLINCVHPFLRRAVDQLERWPWRRHYAGGPHLRVALRASAPIAQRIGEELEAHANSFISANPSSDLPRYSPERAANLLQDEGEIASPEELVYRNNVVVERPYRRDRYVYASEEAAVLSEDFRHDVAELAVSIIVDAGGKTEAMLRLFFLLALTIGDGDARPGSVSFKSHWEGFASWSEPALVDRVRAGYDRMRARITAVFEEVLHFWNHPDSDQSGLLGEWQRIIAAYEARSRRLIEDGIHLTSQPTDPEAARAMRNRVFERMRRDSAFVRRLWADERFMASLQYEPNFLVPRVLTNLLYLLVAAVGLHAIDKMTLCYYAHRTVEENFGCDLDDVLDRTIQHVTSTHAHRWRTHSQM